MKSGIFAILIFTFLGSNSQIYISWKLDKSFETFYPDSLFNNWGDYKTSIQKIQFKAFEEGYLEFSVDSLIKKDSTFFEGYIHVGKEYSWQQIELTQSGPKIPKHVKGKWKNQLVSSKDLAIRLNQIVHYFSNNGYPFAKVSLERISLHKKLLSASILVEPGKSMVWDTLNIVGELSLKKYYLDNYLGINKNKPFSEKVFSTIKKRLQELPFVEMTKTPEISFNEKKVSVTLFVKQKSANLINGVIGVLPNSKSSLIEDKSKLVLTGDLNLNLGNSFGYGETIKINWKRIQSESQRLNTKEEIPYILGSFIGITHSLDILKQDSSYINFKNRLGVKYDLSVRQSFTAFWENEGTNSLSSEVLDNSKLTSVSGSKNSSGLKLFLNWLDYKYNPRKGFYMSIEGKAGFKKIAGVKEGNLITLPIFDSSGTYTSLYVPETSSIIEGKTKLEGYLPIWQSISIKLANNSGFIINKYLLDNDLYRLGGFSLLRGFDQQSVFSTNYSIFTTEIRVLFEENSFFNLFFDKSILQKLTLLKNEFYTASALGAGMNFQAKPGIFSISYALGKFSNTKFEFSSAKIHFGFINLF